MTKHMQPEIRKVVYELFASCYLHEPKLDTVNTLPEALEMLNQAVPNLICAELMEEANARGQLLTTNEANISELRQEHYNHFHVPASSHYIPPYASALLNRTGKKYGALWGDVTKQIVACYDIVGFDPAKLDSAAIVKDNIIPDHIGYTLAFMSYLAASEVKSDKYKIKWGNLQKQFASTYLEPFVNQYCLLSDAKASKYYKQLAIVVKKYVSQDTNYLSNKFGGDNIE